MTLFIVITTRHTKCQYVLDDRALDQAADVCASSLRHARVEFAAKGLRIGITGDKVDRATKGIARIVGRLWTFDDLNPLQIHQAERRAAVQHVDAVNKERAGSETG